MKVKGHHATLPDISRLLLLSSLSYTLSTHPSTHQPTHLPTGTGVFPLATVNKYIGVWKRAAVFLRDLGVNGQWLLGTTCSELSESTVAKTTWQRPTEASALMCCWEAVSKVGGILRPG